MRRAGDGGWAHLRLGLAGWAFRNSRAGRRAPRDRRISDMSSSARKTGSLPIEGRQWQAIICAAHCLTMSSLRANQALVADEILLDGRLALFHQRERWLAVADLHFGYELSQRAAGRLVPLWGMASVSERLLAAGRGISAEPPDYSRRSGARSDRGGRSCASCSRRSGIFANRSSWREITIGNCAANLNWSNRGRPSISIFIMAIASPRRRIGSRSSGIIIPRHDHGRRGTAAEMPGFRSAIALLDHAGVFSLGERHALDGGRRRAASGFARRSVFLRLAARNEAPR